MFMPPLFAAFLLLVSPAVGSFLAVLVDRLPRGEDVVRVPSACRGCKTPLRVRHLIPVISFVTQRGRCSYCAAPIPAWLLYIEILAAGAALLALLAGGTVAMVLLNVALLWILIALAASDLLWFRLPDPLTAALELVALLRAAQPGGHGLAMGRLGALIGMGSFAALRWGYASLRGRQGLVLGDVKLMAGLGAFAGPWDLPLLVLVAALLALSATLWRQYKRGRDIRADLALPFGGALCTAAALLWLVEPP